MSYIVFDLDETLAHVHSVFYFLMYLNYPLFNKDQNPSQPLIRQNKLEDAYKKFVKAVAEKEDSEEPLGILAPGILDLMKQLKRFKDSGKLKGVAIYSNNGFLLNLHFVRDVIHEIVGPLICDCIHWGHHERQVEYTMPISPSGARKTWAVLAKILQTGPCKAPPTLKPSDVYFVDDLKHPDLVQTLKDHYFLIPPYKYKTNLIRVFDIFEKVLTEEDMDQLMAIHKTIHTGSRIEMDDVDMLMVEMMTIMNRFTKGAAGYDSVPPPKSDYILNTLMPIFEKELGEKSGGNLKKTRRKHKQPNRANKKRRKV
jgi:hypothetical protein